MRVLFDGFWWAAGPPSNRAVQCQLIRSWVEHFPDDEVVVAIRRSAQLDPADLDLPVRWKRTVLWPHGLSNAVELPLLARRVGADVVVAHNFTPIATPAMTFVHDLMFIDHPEWFSRAERLYFAAMLPLTRAGAVATSSAAEAARIARIRPSLGAIPAIGLAVSPGLTAAPAEAIDGIDAAAGFSVTVGRLNVRKNLGGLLDAVAHSRCVTAASPLLVVGSGAHSGVPPVLTGAQQELVDSGRVRLLGFVSDAQLRWLYEHARLFASLSRDEGFGLTPLEATYFGCPLLVSDIPAHRETVGDRAHFVELTDSPQQIAHRFDEVFREGRAAHCDQPVPAIAQADDWSAPVHALREAIAEQLAARKRPRAG